MVKKKVDAQEVTTSAFGRLVTAGLSLFKREGGSFFEQIVSAFFLVRMPATAFILRL
jgi:hypothetical protein